jgi:hypothetical protein
MAPRSTGVLESWSTLNFFVSNPLISSKLKLFKKVFKNGEVGTKNATNIVDKIVIFR